MKQNEPLLRIMNRPLKTVKITENKNVKTEKMEKFYLLDPLLGSLSPFLFSSSSHG